MFLFLFNPKAFYLISRHYFYFGFYHCSAFKALCYLTRPGFGLLELADAAKAELCVAPCDSHLITKLQRAFLHSSANYLLVFIRAEKFQYFCLAVDYLYFHL